MEMEKAHYAVVFKREYLEFRQSPPHEPEGAGEEEDVSETADAGPIVVSITQGGFGQDVVDDERQAKERFLEYMFAYSGLDVPRSAESFDKYFELRPLDEIVDLDEEF
jgi:hypothetical protein